MIKLPIGESLLKQLEESMEGELYYNELMKSIYATDASVYREMPLAVAVPKNSEDLKKLIEFSRENHTSLIPRAAGTSLAGQTVGRGIVVDISKHFNKILDFNPEERWVVVQPGVIRDELNQFLKPHGLFFSPITSTANRAMIGGMVGNNSSGATSIVYGSTRDHVVEMKTLLSDGSEATFKAINQEEFEEKSKSSTLEGIIYQEIHRELANPVNQQNIRDHFPKKSIHRRNTGYAVDYLMETEIFSDNSQKFNFCKLLSGSEGTLAFSTEIKLQLDPVQKPVDIIVAIHCADITESLYATQVAMKHSPDQCELIDKHILDCTRENIKQRQNRWFIEGDPEGLLMVEFRDDSIDLVTKKGLSLIADLKKQKMGYAYPIIGPEKTAQVRELRKAGLGLLANISGDRKAVACIEDTAVALEDLPNYINEVGEIFKQHGQKQVVYAHAGAGELHLRPLLNLKSSEDVDRFYKISAASANLVKKYRGSLSGEHGDGRLRGQFIPVVVGQSNYELFKRIKKTWDPHNIFNPGKIVDTLPMNSFLRHEVDKPAKRIETLLNYSNEGGILNIAEKCNGSGDCRKLSISGGTMCPSYQASRNEKDSTRARANILREFLNKENKSNPFDHEEIKEVLDLCLSCKGCTSECPSNVDMASMKAEFLHQYYEANGTPFRARVFAHINDLNELGGLFPSLYNYLMSNTAIASFTKKALGVASQRSLPAIHAFSLRRWFKRNYVKQDAKNGRVILFCDEFTNWNDTEIGVKTIQLLQALHYDVQLVSHTESGRAAISKGLLRRAKKLANRNIRLLADHVSEETPLLGIEPSAILSFRDEYLRLADKSLLDAARKIRKSTFMIEEFLSTELKRGKISSKNFSKEHRKISLHGHCHQKSLGDIKDTVDALSIPENFEVSLIPSGCCGMAGSFGYEKEHFEISQQIGNLVLFPAIKKLDDHQCVVAPGTSCRHQIKDATNKRAYHSVEVLWSAVRKSD